MANNASSGWIRPFIIIAFLAAAACGVYYYFGHRGDKGPEYATAPLSRGELIQVVTATGILQPILTTNVSSQISGIVSKLNVDFNSPVKKGEVLAQLDPATYQANLEQTEGQFANAKANYELAKVNASRQSALFEQKLISQADFDTANANLQQAEAQVQIQQAAVDNAKVNLARCTIYAPFDGIVTSRQVDIGNTVAASLSAPTLFVIANDLTKMQIDASVSEADIGNVELEQNVNFTVDAFPNRPFRGKVFQIRNFPTTQQNVVVYDTMIAVDNKELKLKPGMTANVSIVVAERQNALRIPNSALRVRMPEGIISTATLKTGPGSSSTNSTQATRPATREEMRQIMGEAGFEPGSGPPSPEVRAKMQELAKARGLELPNRGGDRSSGNNSTTTIRTVYRLPSPKAVPESLSVKLGISDGIYTEVLDGLKEDDNIITSVTLPSSHTAQPSASPFGGGGMRRGF